MELFINEWEPATEIYYRFGAIVFGLLIAISILILNLYIKKKKGKPADSGYRIKSLIVILGFVGALVFTLFLMRGNILYVLDLKKYGTEQTNEVIFDVEYSRIDCIVTTREGNVYTIINHDYKTKDYREASEVIMQDFMGKSCIIEYYKYSKYIKSIKLIE